MIPTSRDCGLAEWINNQEMQCESDIWSVQEGKGSIEIGLTLNKLILKPFLLQVIFF